MGDGGSLAHLKYTTTHTRTHTISRTDLARDTVEVLAQDAAGAQDSKLRAAVTVLFRSGNQRDRLTRASEALGKARQNMCDCIVTRGVLSLTATAEVQAVYNRQAGMGANAFMRLAVVDRARVVRSTAEFFGANPAGEGPPPAGRCMGMSRATQCRCELDATLAFDVVLPYGVGEGDNLFKYAVGRVYPHQGARVMTLHVCARYHGKKGGFLKSHVGKFSQRAGGSVVGRPL